MENIKESGISADEIIASLNKGKNVKDKSNNLLYEAVKDVDKLDPRLLTKISNLIETTAKRDFLKNNPGSDEEMYNEIHQMFKLCMYIEKLTPQKLAILEQAIPTIISDENLEALSDIIKVIKSYSNQGHYYR